MKALYWAVVGATVASYGILVLIAGEALKDLTQGAVPFDLRLVGYGVGDARAYLADALPGAAALYETVVRPVDTVFPILFAITLGWPVLARLDGWWRGLALFALAYLYFDLAENAAISEMFRTGASVTADAVSAASLKTVLKFVMVPPAVAACLYALIMKGRSA